MEKTQNTNSALVVSKSGNGEDNKIVFRLTAQNTIKALLCFAMEFSGVFASMSPFGIAFYASVFSHNAWVANFIAAMLGIILSGKSFFWTYAIVLTTTTVVFAVSDKVSKSVPVRAIVCGALFVIMGCARYLRSSFTGFDIMALILEGAFMGVGVIVFSYGFEVFLNLQKRSFISEKETICAYATLAIAILSLRSLPAIAGLNTANVVSMVIIFILCIAGNSKSALIPAILLGVINAMGTSGKSEVMGTFAFGALLAGSLRQYGKTGVVLGFITANTASSLFLTDAEQIVLSIYDSFAASVIFMFVPGNIIRYFSLLSAKSDTLSASGAVGSTTQAYGERLRRMSGSLRKLSAIYETVSRPRTFSHEYIKNTAIPVKEKICAGCPSREKCYNVQNGYIYENIQKYLSTPSLRVIPSTLEGNLKTICHRKDGLCSELGILVNYLRNDMRWINKLNESRKLISEQLRGISDAIETESSKLHTVRNKELEEKLWIEFDKSEIFPVSLRAVTFEDNFEIKISFKEQNTDKKLASKCKACIEKALNTKTEFGGAIKSKGVISFSFHQSCAYNAVFGYATRQKHGETVNGDSFNVIYTDRNRMVMALSDGMGSGEHASQESSLVINMLDNLLNSGIECDTAINLINSSLLLKGAKESFATLDVCDVNLNEKMLTFTKLGAAQAYIKTGNEIKKISGKSLPAGILTEAKAEKHMLPIDSECVVLLISDGVADIALKNETQSHWIENELLKITNSNPQIIAAKILETALNLSGKTAQDDMSVVAACISRNDNH